MSKTTFQNLELLRQEMRKNNVDAMIVPGTDPHQSEYIAPHWQFREWLTGFDGSNGTAVVTLDKAALWTDSRYFLQAEQQLEDSGFVLMKEGVDGEPDYKEWLADNLEEDGVIAVDGRLFSLLDANRLELFCGENGFMFAPNFNPADSIWANRPPMPQGKAMVHEIEYAGEDTESKLTRTLEVIEANNATAALFTALDDIAWMLNIRGNDVEFTPVVISFFFLSEDERVLFIDDDKITPEVKEHLKKYKIKTKDYDDIEKFLNRVSERETVLLDPNKVSDTLGQAMGCPKVYAPSPAAALKAIKNETQIEGFRHAMERDATALVRTFMWIEQNADNGINEIDIWDQAKKERAKSELYRGDSFAMIAGYREHGAIVHYEATEESAATLQPTGLLLLDSGAQYLDGTTDITRTITLGNPTEQEKHDFTLVLKGHLALARAQFPAGTRGVQLDALARMPLWSEGLTYGHGTGHGVGHFLGCHEGPHSIRTDLNPVILRAGMVTSNEPGLYRTGEYGIRTENLILVTQGDSSEEFGRFLRFETLTLFPYDTRLIDTSMLTPQEVKQINDYHDMVLERVSPLLNDEEKQWLENKCAHID